MESQTGAFQADHDPLRTEGPHQPRRQAFILTLWSMPGGDGTRGCLELVDGTRNYFTSVGQLNVLFHDLGWFGVSDSAETKTQSAPPTQNGAKNE